MVASFCLNSLACLQHFGNTKFSVYEMLLKKVLSSKQYGTNNSDKLYY